MNHPSGSRDGGQTVLTASTSISPPTAALSGHIATALRRELPATVAEKAKHHLLDTLAAMISGSRLKPGELAIRFAAEQGGKPEAQIAGSAIVTSAINAALANGMLAHADETDDSHPIAFIHPGCAIVPAALAMAEARGRSGADLLKAVVVGYDVGARVTLALGVDRFYGEHHHSTHSFGALFGATAAAAVLAGLNERQVRWALSYAAQQASGIACWARDEEHVEKAFDFGGMGARNGVAAAAMVAADFSGVEDVFAGPRNFFAAFGGDPALLARDLGTGFEIMACAIKKWSVGSPIQAPLDSLEALIAAHRLTPDNIVAIEARVSDKEAHIVDDRSMPDICLQHLLAVLLLDGTLTFRSSHDYARMSDPAVQALRRKITLIHDPALPRREGQIRATTMSNAQHDHHTRFVRGTAGNPMTRQEIAAKARDLTAEIIGTRAADALIAQIWEIEALTDVRALRPLLTA